MDAAEGAPRADKSLVAVGDKRANCLRNRFIRIGGKVSLALGKLLDKFGILPGERTVDVKEADISMIFGGVDSMRRRDGGRKTWFEPHNLIKVLFDTGNRDADDHLGCLAGDDEALGAHCDKGRVVRHDRRVYDFDAQPRGAVGCAHNVRGAAQKRYNLLGEQMILRCLAFGSAGLGGALFVNVASRQARERRATGNMVLASRGFKAKGQDKASKAQEEDGAKDESDSERQKVRAGMRPHERDEGSHLHEAAREDADDAKEVHGHGEAGR